MEHDDQVEDHTCKVDSFEDENGCHILMPITPRTEYCGHFFIDKNKDLKKRAAEASNDHEMEEALHKGAMSKCNMGTTKELMALGYKHEEIAVGFSQAYARQACAVLPCIVLVGGLLFASSLDSRVEEDGTRLSAEGKREGHIDVSSAQGLKRNLDKLMADIESGKVNNAFKAIE